MKHLFTFLLLLFAAVSFNAQVVVTEDITTNTTWTSDNEYILDGLIFVEEGTDLTIEPGTVIKGKKQDNITTGDGASALIIRRGAKIIAEGTASAPIIFTSEDDDLTRTDDLFASDRGLWGGLILLGKATTNQPTTENLIEGIPPELNAAYGGDDDNDNSGTLKYISIRHGGFSISGVPGDEINGLSMGAVGKGTTIEHIEVFANFDDGYEWWGGTVQCKWLVAAACGDDSFDYDQGFRGKGQYWFSFALPDAAGRGGEHDGGDDDLTGEPFSIPMISNVTYIGSGSAASSLDPEGDQNDWGIRFRENAGGKYYNGIITEFAGSALRIDGAECLERYNNADLTLEGMYFWNFGGGSTWDELFRAPDDASKPGIISYLESNDHLADPGLVNIAWTPTRALDPRPDVDAAAASGAVEVPDAWFESTSYAGAFAPGNELWTKGWTAIDAYGYTANVVTDLEEDVISTTPSSFELAQNYPNPFNPTTKIQFSLPEAAKVKLTVYNILGQQVAELANGQKSAGTYSITWDAADLTSGVYIYRLEAGNQIVTKKMTLLK